MTFPKFLPSLKGLGFLIHAYPGLTPWANLIAAAARLVLRQLQPLAPDAKLRCAASSSKAVTTRRLKLL